jgi:tetratricopeptide (TPR) repeat protein
MVVVAGLMVFALVAYANSFAVPFVFDDEPTIAANSTIRDLSDLTRILAPQEQGGLTVSGRPLVNLSLALNYALSREQVWSYHATNLLIHFLAGLALFALIRRTLWRCGWAGGATWEGMAVAALWLVHPLQTEAVTYLSQRAEALAGLCYLVTIYGFSRSDGARTGRWWRGLSVLACFAGVASKETAVSAPLMVLLYDRTFVAGSFGGAWSQRRGYYLALASSWLLLAWLVAGTHGRGGTAGFSTEIGVSAYAITQCHAVVRYLALSLWPHPLVFDYGVWTAASWAAVWSEALLLTGLVAVTVWALWRRPAWGFLGCWFFAVLAPSSSIVPIATQTMAEHRMYLALAAVIAAVVIAVVAHLKRMGWWLCVIAAVAATIATIARNRDYRSEVALWTDTVQKRPMSARAHNNLGQALFKEGRWGDSVSAYREALRLQPRFPEVHYNLGLALARLERRDEALREYAAAVTDQPTYAEAHNALGSLLLDAGRPAEAVASFQTVLQLRPDDSMALANLGLAFSRQGRWPEALAQQRRVVELQPDNPEGHSRLGETLARAGDVDAASRAFERALTLRPDYFEARTNWGAVLASAGRMIEAQAQFASALQLRPDSAEAHNNLANVLVQSGKVAEALTHYQSAVQIQPGYALAHRNRGLVLARMDRPAEALTALETAVRLDPADAIAARALQQLRQRAPSAASEQNRR